MVDWKDRVFPIVLVAGALLVSGLSIFIASQRDLTSLENTLLQTVSLALGLIGSFIFGMQSASQAAKELLKPLARSAFRRLISLLESLSRVAYLVEAANTSSEKDKSIALAKLEAIVVEQLATADDALEDWNDIVPDEVAELKNKWKGSRNSGGRDDN